MKRKIFNILVALTLVLGLSLVMAAPVAAVAVGTPTVALSSYLASAADVQYTISFDLGASLSIGNTITIDFDDAYVSPATVANNEVTIDGGGILGAAVVIGAGDVWVITLAAAISTSTNPVVVVITSAANLPNPVAGDYTLTVATSAETATASAAYTILSLPTVTGVSPAAGNVGDTMWVEVTGTTFTGTTAACTTTFSFGSGASVVSGSYHWISATSVDCQITITAAGTLAVAATTTAGTGTVTGVFTTSAAGTAQVDVWLDYTPTTDVIFDADTLVPKADTMTYTTTVKAAVDVLTASDTAIVHAATYTETAAIPMNDASSKLLSLNGAATTIINVAAASDGIDITAASVTVDGFTLEDTATGYWAINVTGASATVENNIMTAEEGYPGLRIAASSATVSGNELDIHHTMMLISGATITLSDNIFGAGINIQNVSAVDIIDNTIIGSEFTGIVFESVASFNDILIDGNTISGTTLYEGAEGIGISFRPEVTTLANLTIQRNNITDNEGPGILIPATVTSLAGTVVINYNNIYGNGDYGIENLENTAVNAKYNWWGEISGPAPVSTDVAAKGNGDIISTYVTYSPWLTEPYESVIDDGVRAYGSDTIALAIGWNTLSVPCVLKTTGNTFGEIQDMGDYLDDMVSAYWYDAAADTPIWTLATSSTELVPGLGFYIKMSVASTFPVLYLDSGLGLPSYDLSAGWNLVGSMLGIDRTGDSYAVAATSDGQGEGWQYPLIALDSIQTNGSIIISPSVPGQVASWATTVAHTGTNKMYVGEAYWVFMEADGTLAGLEVTPYYFTWATAET